MTPNHRIPSALYCDLFYNNPGAAEFRTAHLTVWVQTHLYPDQEKTIEEVTEAFRASYPGIDVSEGIVETVLGHLADAGLVDLQPPIVKLSKAGRSSVKAAKDRYERSRQRFLSAITSYLRGAELDGLSDEELDRAVDCAEDLVVRILTAEREALETLYEHVSDFAYVSNQARERRAELGACLEAGFDEVLATRVRELRRETLHGIARATEEGRTFLHTLNRSVVSSFFLIKDPHHAENIRARATERTYYLDTNVYLAWLYPSQPAHEIVKPLMETLRHHGAEVRVIPETVEEIRRIEAQATSVVPRALGDPSFAKYLEVNRKAIFTDYWWARRRDENLQFSTFADLHMDPDRTLPRLGVEVVPVEFDPDEDFDEILPTFRNAIRGVKEQRGRMASTDALDHDAALLVSLAKLQLRGDRDEWGSRVQLLSLDGSLGPAIEEARNMLNRRFEWPIHPNSLARLLLPAAGPELDQEQYETFVAAAVRENLGLLQEVSGYSSVELIEKIDRAGIPTRTLLAAPPDLLERALAQLQGRKDLNRKLDQALTQNETERRPILREIQKDLEEAVSVGSDLLRETEAQLAGALSDQQKMEVELAEMRSEMRSLRTTVEKQNREIEAGQHQVTALQQDAAARRRKERALLIAVAVLVVVLVVIVLL